MVGKKGMKQSGHRIFAYKERKFNTLGERGLIDYFRTKADPDLIRHHFLTEHHGLKLSGSEVKSLAMELNKKYWEDEKEFITATVEGILHLSKVFDITNIEAFATVLYLYKAVGIKENLTDKERGDIIEKTLKEANDLRLTNWNSFMRILKEVT